MSTSRRLAPGCTALALVLLTGACDGPLSPAPPAAPADAAIAASRAADDGTVTVPFEARFFTDLVSIAPDASCGGPPMLLNTQQGFGEATHLGRFSVLITFCFDPSELLDDGQLSPGESLPYENGVGTMTAANGDQLRITIAGAVLPSDHPDFDFEFSDPYEIVGGTGRFDGATGGGVTNSLVDFQSQPSRTEHDWSGTLVLRPGNR